LSLSYFFLIWKKVKLVIFAAYFEEIKKSAAYIVQCKVYFVSGLNYSAVSFAQLSGFFTTLPLIRQINSAPNGQNSATLGKLFV